MSKVKKNPKIVKLLADADVKHTTSDHAQIVSICDEVIEHLVVDKLALKGVEIYCKRVGVHPANRGGLGASGRKAHTIGSQVHDIGFSESYDAICFEDEHHKCEEFTLKLVSEDEFLARYEKGEIEYGSAGATHLNQFYAAATDKRPSECTNVSDNGFLSPTKISNNRPRVAHVLEKGLRWTVIKSPAEILYPTLPDVVQRAKNAPQAVAQDEDEFQILHRAVVVKKVMPWDAVDKDLRQSKPKCVDDIPAIINYAQKWAGENINTFISPLCQFIKTYKPVESIVPGSTFEALAKLKLGPKELCPFFITGCLMAQATAPSQYVFSRMCRFITKPDIQSLQGNNKDKMIAAEKILVKCRKLTENASISDGDRIAFFGKLDTSVVRFVFGKQQQTKYESMNEIASEFIENVKACSPKNGNISNSFGVAHNKATKEQTAIADDQVLFNETGAPLAVCKTSLAARGFNVGIDVTGDEGVRDNR